MQNQPNPFNPTTRIRFRLAKTEHVHLAVYDIAGRLVRTLANKTLPGGQDLGITWDGKNRLGQPMRSGIYVYRITTPSFSESRKMTLLQ
jgi:flagellar hook assembly protein FlgD